MEGIGGPEVTGIVAIAVAAMELSRFALSRVFNKKNGTMSGDLAPSEWEERIRTIVEESTQEANEILKECHSMLSKFTVGREYQWARLNDDLLSIRKRVHDLADRMQELISQDYLDKEFRNRVLELLNRIERRG